MPDAPAPRPFSAFLLLAAVGVGVVVVMLLAAFMPRTGAEERVNWLVPFGGGVVAAVATYAVGAMRKGPPTTRAEPPR